MSSERRLHPASFLFIMGGQLKELLLPGLIVVFTAGSTGRDWETWLMLLVIPYTILALGRTVSYRYRFDEGEMVVRTGFVFRNERRIPYARIQSIDGIARLPHRLLGVVEVRVQTGAGAEPEAIMRVLPLGAAAEMRDRVAVRKGTAEPPGGAAPVPVPTATPVLRLPLGELLLAGFIDNRGVVVIAAAFGLLWEFGLLNRVSEAVSGSADAGRGVIRQFARALIGGGVPSARYVFLSLLAFAVVLAFIRLLSMAQSAIRLYGFTLVRDGEELRAEYGLFTRITSTIPLRRIQLLTVTETPLHRLFARVNIRVDTAGGGASGQGTAQREALAPIVRTRDLAGVLGEVLPGIAVTGTVWQPVARGAARREFIRRAVPSGVISAAALMMLGRWTFVLLAGLLAIAAFSARRYVGALGWAAGDGAVLVRSGWLWRTLRVTRYSRIQAVRMTESPFDRRTRMGRVAVDTAGAGGAARGIEIPYLPRQTASVLRRTLTAEAARTTFRW
ncbi:MAG TPA: PH domain-containing protein [Vicinamibacterales bacterium]|nr:PH domain-containing protein [Vicinamibacterales bacterium]